MDILVKDNEVQVPEKPLLRYRQREEIKAEVDQIDEALNPNNPYSHLRKSSVDVAEAAARGRRLKKQLVDYSPPSSLPGAAKDKLYKQSKELEEKILQGMPSHEEMRKNPAGMVDRHMKWEAENKKNILKWKNLQILLEPDSSAKDLANFERLRPQGEMDRFRGDAQINGHMTYGNIPEWVWAEIFKNKPNSALEQVKKVEAEVAQPAAKVDKRTLPKTEEQKQALRDRLALARAKQSAAKSGDPVSPQEGESVPFEGA